MRVLHVIDKLNIGGAEKVFVDITHLLTESGIETGALLFHSGGALDSLLDKHVKLHILDRKNKFSLYKLAQASAICKQYDIVHVHMRHCYNYIRLCQLLFGGKYKLILHDHFGDVDINKSVPKGWGSWLKPQYYIGVSRSLVNWAKETVGIDSQNVYLLTNTIVPGQYVHKSNTGQHSIFIVSNIRPTKNLEFGIHLCSMLPYPLTIYGNRSDWDYFNKIKELAEAYDNIHIEEGIKDLTAHFCKHSLALHCAKSETGPLVLLEYLAYGIPFLMYETGEVASVIKDELPLHFMNNFDEQQWIERIELLKQQDNIEEKLRTIFNKYFSPAIYINKCQEIYRSVNY